MQFQLRHVQHAIALAEEGSSTAAPRRLNLSQPALSRRIQTLEELLVAPFRPDVGRDHADEDWVIVVERGKTLLQDAASVEREVQLALGL
jgi:DNA-binding transcriptional LysR family regulator